jgi:hypothetical protein
MVKIVIITIINNTTKDLTMYGANEKITQRDAM